jgi:hypothetical protein
VGADETETLRRGYWPSYNVPYFPEIYKCAPAPAALAAPACSNLATKRTWGTLQANQASRHGWTEQNLPDDHATERAESTAGRYSQPVGCSQHMKCMRRRAGHLKLLTLVRSAGHAHAQARRLP